MLAFWDQHGSQSFLQSATSHHCKHSSKKDKNLPLLGWYPDSSPIKRRTDTTTWPGITDPLQFRLACKFSKETINTISKDGVPGPDFRHTKRTDLPARSQSGQADSLRWQCDEITCTFSKRLHDTPGDVYGSKARSTLGEVSRKSFSDIFLMLVEWRIPRAEDPFANTNPPEPCMVEVTGHPVAGHVPQPRRSSLLFL